MCHIIPFKHLSSENSTQSSRARLTLEVLNRRES